MEIIADSFEDFSAGPQLAGVFDGAAAIAAVEVIAEKGKIGRPAGTKIPEGYKTGSLESRKAASGGAIALKTDNQKIRELKQILLSEDGQSIVRKAIEIALNDGHPSQAAMIKLCMDRTLPVSMFEKDKQQRSAVTINITGLGAVVEPAIIDGGDAEDVTDV
jgi:hypothetical protein